MTGGTVVVLGLTGRNFAAGMSGGVAYVYDVDGLFAKRCNTSMVSLESVPPAAQQRYTHACHNQQADETQLKALIEQHFAMTGSPRARLVLEHWKVSRTQFVKVFPIEYARALKTVRVKPTGLTEAAALEV
jgi:glutamate synthase domain-containing protein 3